MLDTRLSYREHLEFVNKKASETTGSLCRILLNTRGPKQDRRRLLATVVKSQLLYAAPLWAEATAVSSYMRGVNSTYRLCAFRTISDDAALVIAGQVPLCELVREAKEIRAALAGEQADRSTKTEVKRRARMQSVVNWQAAWDISSKGRWTHKLIPSIEPWLSRKHGQVDFYLTQALSGHGCFRSFLKRFGHDTEDGCPECGSGIVEDAQHVLFECRRFGYDRQILTETTGARVRPETFVPLMLLKEANWEATAAYAASVLRTLRRTDNERREVTA